MSTDRINYLNLALMLTAAGVAFVAPFEVFLLAYAVLGPCITSPKSHGYTTATAFSRAGATTCRCCFCACGAILMPAMRLPSNQTDEVAALINYVAFAVAAVLMFARTAASRMLAVGSSRCPSRLSRIPKCAGCFSGRCCRPFLMC